MNQLQVDDLALALRFSSRRKTLQITVDRNGELVLSAPSGVDEQVLRSFVREKRYWIYTKLAEKAQHQRKIPRKQFVDGEGFLYLGRSYRLKLVEEGEPLKLVGGRFRLRRDLADDGRRQFIRWYSARGRDWLAARAAANAARMEVSPAGIKVQDLGYPLGLVRQGGLGLLPLEDSAATAEHR